MKRITLRLPLWIYEILAGIAKKRGQSLNSLINSMCYEFTEKNKEH